MNLGELLEVVGLNRNSYNTMGRRAQLDFMREPSEGSAANRYTAAHAFCLSTVLDLQYAGLSLVHAVTAVNELQYMLKGLVEELWENTFPELWLSAQFTRDADVGDIKYHLEYSRPSTPPAETRYFIAINMILVWKDLFVRLEAASNEGMRQWRGF